MIWKQLLERHGPKILMFILANVTPQIKAVVTEFVMRWYQGNLATESEFDDVLPSLFYELLLRPEINIFFPEVRDMFRQLKYTAAGTETKLDDILVDLIYEFIQPEPNTILEERTIE